MFIIKFMNENRISWGIIGAGDVAEVKSGPAFNKVTGSELLAVMRRNPDKAEDFARRHGVSSWYSSVEEILARDDINAVYIATPPSSHRELAVKALEAGKHVYLEKPVCLTADEARLIKPVLDKSGKKLVVAHYRRGLDSFKTVKKILDAGEIGDIQFVQIRVLQRRDASFLTITDDNWRENPAVSGGGLFTDIAPHQIDLMLHYFGDVKESSGCSLNRSKLTASDDYVAGRILFESGIPFEGLWSFTIDHEDHCLDCCEIYGSEGKLTFSFFGEKLSFFRKGSEKVLNFTNPVNIQQPMIQSAVDYFLGAGDNPCSMDEGIACMEILDSFTR
ncbi:Gfo/Idh/MocA family protein [Oceanispirochaeta sp. M1]|uniref:Gfo/Idh/MocA family protein n=2 Tax=Oceanispirochaeta TaxID=2035349 RepID=UPI001C131CF4|nr:Gfo/Idh/MocA family oxidoreductase [Oceanispirochaeta sp. M1]